MSTLDDTTFDRLLNLQDYNDAALKDLVRRLTEEEREVSKKRRLLHAEIDLVRAELVRRLRDKHAAGESVVGEGDLSTLTQILSGQGPRDDLKSSEKPPESGGDLEGLEQSSPILASPDQASQPVPVGERFHDLSANVRDERLVRYVVKQISLGRNLDDILTDAYVTSISGEVKRAELLQNPQIIHAVQNEMKKQFAQYKSDTRASSGEPRSE